MVLHAGYFTQRCEEGKEIPSGQNLIEKWALSELYACCVFSEKAYVTGSTNSLTLLTFASG